jgi:hypothetical protein
VTDPIPVKVFLMGWECRTDSKNETIVTLFDLNQWYKEQMPSRGSTAQSPFIHSVTVRKGPALALSVKPSTFSIYNFINSLEQHYYPSALSYGMLWFLF